MTGPLTGPDRAGALLVDQLVDELRMSRRAARSFVDRNLPAVLAEAQHVPAPPADPDQPCRHLDFEVDADVNRIGEADEGAGGRPRAYNVDLSVRCAHCRERFRFMGVPAGLSFAAPSVTVDEFVLHAPMRPASADPDFGLGIPGFAIRQVRP